jgi:UDP-glucuronate 4-epimerase
MKIFVTGVAGFIGFSLAKTLLTEENTVIGLDNFNPYYEIPLKKLRFSKLQQHKNFIGIEGDLLDKESLGKILKTYTPEIILHLAAQPGVRYGRDHPTSYIDANIMALVHLLEACRHFPPRHLLYASSSSVYGANKKVPFAESDAADWPISLYAASKRAGEHITHSYSHLYQLPTTGLRFFTVYGPWGRPDMAVFKFARALLRGEPISLYGAGELQRDFTYISDVVAGILALIHRPPPQPIEDAALPSSPVAPWQVVNIGHNKPEYVRDLVRYLAKTLERPALTINQPLEAGDPMVTWADISVMGQLTGWQPKISLEKGVELFCTWLKDQPMLQ